MFITIIIVLIVTLVIIAIGVSAVQQGKEKQEAERRKELIKQKKIIEEAEELLANNVNVPMSETLLRALQNRIHHALAEMINLSPDSRELKNRFEESKECIGKPVEKVSDSESLSLPDSDKQLISLLQGIKKLRTMLRSEHSRGKVETKQFVAEDRRLEKLQLKINIDSQIKRGLAARTANMAGSARQYFEKAYATLNSVNYSDEYTVEMKAMLEQNLEEISNELKASNESTVQKKNEQEQDELDMLFAPKKKW